MTPGLHIHAHTPIYYIHMHITHTYIIFIEIQYRIFIETV